MLLRAALALARSRAADSSPSDEASPGATALPPDLWRLLKAATTDAAERASPAAAPDERDDYSA